MGRSNICRSVIRSDSWSVSHSFGTVSSSQAVSRSVSQSVIDRTLGWSTSQPIGRLFGVLVGRFVGRCRFVGLLLSRSVILLKKLVTIVSFVQEGPHQISPVVPSFLLSR